MPTCCTNARCCSSNGASFTKTVSGTDRSPRSANRARPVVPDDRSSNSTWSTVASNASEKNAGVQSVTSTGIMVRRVTSFAVNRQVVLKKRPVGMVTESCFDVVERPMPELGEGEALLVVRLLGIDPTIRGWLDERGNYMAGVGIDEVVRSNGVGVVVQTNNPQEYPLGRAFMHL